MMSKAHERRARMTRGIIDKWRRDYNNSFTPKPLNIRYKYRVSVQQLLKNFNEIGGDCFWKSSLTVYERRLVLQQSWRIEVLLMIDEQPGMFQPIHSTTRIRL
jgi:hypothetical protein